MAGARRSPPGLRTPVSAASKRRSAGSRAHELFVPVMENYYIPSCRVFCPRLTTLKAQIMDVACVGILLRMCSPAQSRAFPMKVN